MSPYLKYPLVLAIVAAASGAALYATYAGTKDGIAAQEAKARVRALGKVFVNGYGATEDVTDGQGGILYTRVWRSETPDSPPDFFAVQGRGYGYNGGVPITLIAGFTNPKKPGPESDRKRERILVGWSVIKSEETPGLGEKIKESAAPYTLADKILGRESEAKADLRTPFQKQFWNPEKDRHYTAEELKIASAGGPIDAITGATYTSLGVIRAIQDADNNLSSALKD
jgi:Na+-translocating ferredoxin:NAD+ oxidoreductase RnfG subunit